MTNVSTEVGQTQFFNAEWAREWVGVYPDSPPPPMPEWED
jgi:hypothetical protein